jgi:hypothetical protein
MAMTTTACSHRRWRLVPALAAVAALAMSSVVLAPPPEAPEADLPITRVVLFTTGVAYVEHGGSVDGDAELELRVPPAAMDDLLQSLVVEDLGGGRVEPVRYGTRDPLGRILASYPLDLSRHPSLADLVAQARGERVRIETDATIHGVIVGVEREPVPEEPPRTYVTLNTDDGLQRLDLASVRSLHFERAELREQLDAALAAIADYRDAAEVPVRLRFSGAGERQVRIGYLRAMPVWKTSYRLLLGDDGADVQGWAIFDNPTSLDFVDVEVAFVAGRPASFVSELFEPVYVERQRVGSAVAAGFVPPTDVGSIPAAAARALMAAPSPMAEAADAVAMPEAALRGAGVEALAEAGAAGATFAYTVREPVTVRRFESVLVPIVRTSVEAHPLSLFDPSVDVRHPLRAVRLVNDTGLHLAPGPVTIFDDHGFTGTALLADLVPDDDRVLSYAIDLDIAVDVTTSSEPEQVVAVRVVGGLLESEYRTRLRSSYRLAPRGEVERFVVVEHPRRAGYEVVAPTPAPALTPTGYRFGVALVPSGGDVPRDPSVATHLMCDGAEPCQLEVVLERVEARRVAVSSVPLERLEAYLQDLELSDQTRAQLEAIAGVQRELLRLDRAIRAERERRDAIFSDQARLRQNMAALDRTSALYRRYVDELGEQEDTLAAIARRLAELEQERSDQLEALEDLIATFGGS